MTRRNLLLACRLVTLGLSLWFLLLAIAPVSAATDVTLTASPSRAKLQRGESGEVFVQLSNQLDGPLRDIRLTLNATEFEITALESSTFTTPPAIVVAELAPGANVNSGWRLRPKSTAPVGTYKVQILAVYSGTASTPFPQQSSTSVDIEVEKPVAPEIVLDVASSRDTLERDQTTVVSVNVTNKSDKTLKGAKLSVDGTAFELIKWVPAGNGKTMPMVVEEHSLGDIPAGGAPGAELNIRPTGDATYKSHVVGVRLTYTWDAAGTSVPSQVSKSVTIAVKRPFDDELSGELTGATAFFFIFPLLPAVVFYQLARGRLKGDPLSVPALGLKQIYLWAVASVAVNLVLQKLKVNVVEDTNYLVLLVASAGVGVLVAGVAYGLEVMAKRAAAAKEREAAAKETAVQEAWETAGISDRAYLLKAGAGEYQKAEIVSDGQTWTGVLLEQRPGFYVIGRTLLAAVNDPVAEAAFEENTVKDVAALVKFADEDKVTLGPRELATRNEEGVGLVEIVPRSEDTTITRRQPSRIVVKSGGSG